MWAAFVLYFLLSALQALKVNSLAIEPGSLRTEGLLNPRGVHQQYPRLTWRLQGYQGEKQTSAQVRIGRYSGSDLWDSGKLASSVPAALYAGPDLASRTTAWWQVRVWDQQGRATGWSERAYFEMGLQHQDWTGQWIQSNFSTGETSLPIFAKTFQVHGRVEKARLYLIGLGLHAAKLNDKAVGDGVLAPGYSNLNKTMYYSTYDVGSLLKNGDNVLRVDLGKGYYDAEPGLGGRYMKYVDPHPRQLMLLAQLEYMVSGKPDAHVIASDLSWNSYLHGPLIESSWYGGEEYDARRKVPTIGRSHGWQGVLRADAVPSGTLYGQPYSDIRAVEDIPCVSVSKVGDRGWTFDFGVNFAGSFKLTIDEPAGTRVVMWPSEIVDGTGWADQSSTGDPIFDAYTSNGTKAQYGPQFMYHGFRYLSVNLTRTPIAASIVGSSIRQAVEAVGIVKSDNQLFNGIHRIIDRSIQSNLYSTLTDCPHREKLGWLEESHLVISPVMWNYDMEAAAKQTLRQIRDAQQTAYALGGQLPTPGFIPEIAPEFTVFGYPFREDPNWGGAISLLPLQHYQEYGDLRVLADNFDAMKLYASYLGSLTSNNTLNYGLGEWEAIETCTSTLLTATYGYWAVVSSIAKVATYLSAKDDAEHYASLAATISAALHNATYKMDDTYDCKSQGALALALDMGLPRSQAMYDAVLRNMVAMIRANGTHWTVGEIALPALLRVLHAAHHDEIIYELMSDTSFPSYGWELEHGATSLWEAWAGADVRGSSLNHFMFGFGDVWLRQLSGIEQSIDSIGWESIDFSPVLPGNLTSASASHRTPRGVVSASWTYHSPVFTYNIHLPPGAKGNVTLPFLNIWAGGRKAQAQVNGVTQVTERGNWTSILVQSGTYNFTAQ